MKKWTPTQNTEKARFYNSLCELREAWRNDSWAFQNDERGLRFICDMIIRMENNKGLSPRQKQFAQNLLDAGVPSKPECPEADEIESLVPFINQRGGNILCDFANKIRQGRQLSEKQRKFMDSLVKEAKVNQANPFVPSEKDIEDMRLVTKCAALYDSMYWGSHQKLASYVQNIRDYLTLLDGVLENQLPLITRNDIDNGLEAVKGVVKQLQKPRVKEGDLVYSPYWAGQAMVCSDVDILEVPGYGLRKFKNVAAKVLIDGILRNVPVDQMSTRNVYDKTIKPPWR